MHSAAREGHGAQGRELATCLSVPQGLRQQRARVSPRPGRDSATLLSCETPLPWNPARRSVNAHAGLGTAGVRLVGVAHGGRCAGRVLPLPHHRADVPLERRVPGPSSPALRGSASLPQGSPAASAPAQSRKFPNARSQLCPQRTDVGSATPDSNHPLAPLSRSHLHLLPPSFPRPPKAVQPRMEPGRSLGASQCSRVT